MPTGAGAAVGKESGRTGLIVSQAGRVEEELLPNLQGRKAIEAFREMRDNDPVVGAILFAIDMLIRQVEWRVDVPEEGDEESGEFLESCMHDMSHSWSDFISEVMSMIVFGFSFHEIVYKKRSGPQKDGGSVPSSKHNDGKIGWRKLPIRGQESLDRWEFDNEGGMKGYVQKPAPKYEDITVPIIKGLLFRTTTFKNNPEGRSALRNAYRPWYYKKRIENIEGVGIERDLAGLPMFGVDPAILRQDASDEDKAMLAGIETLGKNVRRDKQEYIIWPNVYDEAGNKVYTFDLLSSGGSRTFDTSAIIQRYDQRIAMTTLADFILLGHEKVGSFALSSDKTDLFAIALGTYLDIIQDAMNRFAVTRLFEVNGMNLEHMPELKHGDIEKPDLAALASFVQMLAGAGVELFPDEELEKFLRGVANLPEKSQEAIQAQAATKEGGEEPKPEGAAPEEGAPASQTSQADFVPAGAGNKNGNANGAA